MFSSCPPRLPILICTYSADILMLQTFDQNLSNSEIQNRTKLEIQNRTKNEIQNRAKTEIQNCSTASFERGLLQTSLFRERPPPDQPPSKGPPPDQPPPDQPPPEHPPDRFLSRQAARLSRMHTTLRYTYKYNTVDAERVLP